MLRHLRNILIVFLLLSTHLAAKATVYYVTYDGQPVTDGWQTVTTLADAFSKAKSGDEIWIQGSDDVTKAYHITAGLTVKSGVKVYGGFKGNETGIGQREYQGKKQYRLRYRSLISREVNSHIDHVLTMDLNPAKSGNNNTLPTIVNGLSLSNNLPQDNAGSFTEKGGGIFVTGDNSLGGAFHIEQCCLVENRAAEGAGIYVDSNVQTTALGENLIDHCAVFNNVAGSQNVLANNGGGLYIAGAATVVNSVIFNNVNGGVRATAKTDNSEKAKIVSCSVTRNSGSGIDGPGMPVYNTVIWGNTIFTTSEDTKPDFYHSAFSRATDEDKQKGNIYLSIRNRDTEGPDFVLPSLRRGYDADFKLLEDDLYPYWDWEPNGVTILVDSGDNSLYDASRYGSVDMNDEPRVYNDKIDIGAYEYEPVSGSRIRYVRTDGVGRGASWSDASNDLQAMIDELAESGGGEVWVAEGTYSPKVPLVSSLPYTATFRMRDGVSVYGGFAGTEKDKTERKKKDGGMPWDFIHETTLQGASYIGSVTWGNNELSVSSDSRHVVWFAPFLPDGGAEKEFSTLTRLEGFTVRGGNAQGGNGETDFLTDRGGGIYMKGQNVMVENCIIKENAAMRHGGGVYMADGARLRTSLVYNNNAGDDGGAAYVEHDGLIHRCMLANNYGDNGAGIYLNAIADKPTAVTASTNVITNNTARNNGAVYCNLGGVLLHNTIANNYCPKSVDAAYTNTSQTGGVYINEYALLVNSVLWNNRFGSTGEPADVPVYAKNPTNAKVRFLYNAISGADNAIWNYITQEGTVRILEKNQKESNETLNGPAFSSGGVMTSNDVLKKTYGVQQTWTNIDYYWKPMKGSSLWSAGMPLPQFPNEVQLAPELDVEGRLFAEKPTIGAFRGDNIDIRYDATTDQNKLIVYVAYGHASTYDDGRDWDHPYRSINNAINYLADLPKAEVGGRTLEVRVMEGDLWPRYAYTDEDDRSATIIFKNTASGAKLRLVGGYYRDGNNVRRAPIEHRSVLNGNPDGENLENGFYHVVTVEEGADIELDGVHIVNGYVAPDVVMPHGAGLLAYDNAKVTLLNCTFEDNTAVMGAAIYAPSTATVTMRNCVVNNNTCSTQTNPLIVADDLTMEHVTIVNNVGVAKVSGSSSFAAGNTSGNTLTDVATVGGMGEGQKGQLNFANPTNDVGAKLGFDTYLGGYTVFRPLTSSNDVSVIINKATGISTVNTDITAVNDRDLGGVPDLGAYEAELPKNGRVYYVRTDGNDNNDGTSWGQSFKTISKAVNTAKNGTVENNEKPQVWVAAGTYKANPNSEGNCFVIEDGVNVFGAFPANGNPGINERHPLRAQSVSSTDYAFYETILTSESSKSRRILGSADEYNPKSNKATFQYETTWDGFTITGGDLNKESGRDGGAGARVFKNMNLKDCVVTGNNTYTSNSAAEANARGGGVYSDGGSIVNCYLINNTMKAKSHSRGAYYGGGAYLYKGTMYNCVVANNHITASYADGAGLFLENATFYNNTVVNNTGTGTSRASGGITVWKDDTGDGGLLNLYNCIIAGNNGFSNLSGNKNIAVQKGIITFYNTLLDTDPDDFKDKYDWSANVYTVQVYYKSYCLNYTNKSTVWTDIFNSVNISDFSKSDYRLNGKYPSTFNMGQDIIGSVNLSEYTDMDFTDRIKDCRVDAGAYEFENIVGTTPEIVTAKNDANKKMAVYYVTQNGNETGNMSGSSLANAACATKLQTVLDAAGEYAKDVANGKRDKVDAVIVKVAGYADSDKESTPYHATKLADEKDPQSYSYSVPYGVTLMGGFNDQAADWNDSADRKKDDNGNVIRDVMKFPTVLSPIKKATATTTQDINGYHAVTFMEKPQDWTGADAKTIIDGVYLEGGAATSLAGEGNPNTQGGGAIVPAWAHVRNCGVQNNTAMYGGGLYVLPGGTVSGCAILHNTAEKEGGGIYVSAKGLTTGYPAYLISNTIADNEAQLAGGVYSEKGAAMFANSVIFGNNAGSNKNVSADLNPTKAELFEQVYKKADGTSEIEDWYPFNKCYVEAVELPGNFFNMSMINDKTTYFNDDDDYTPKPYSLLISHGMTTYFQQQLEALLGVAAYDMRGVQRVDYPDDKNISVDCGAYAVIDAKVQDKKLVKRLFVSRGLNVIMGDGTYIGQSFYTPFSWLGDALEYIRTVRENNVPGAKEAEFEIFVASGTYKPRRRADAHTVSGGVTDQRQNSFSVPYNVKIYGGFSGYETYCSHEDGGSYSPAGVDGTLSFVDITGYEAEEIKEDILDKREYSDYNGNNILEPWEMAHGTILSGAIDMEGNEQNTYHVLYSDRGTSTGDPETQSVTLDGLTVMNGKTKDFLYSETGGDDNSEVGRGAGLYSNGVDYKIVNCRFMDNEAVRGGGIYVRNGNLTSINSAFAGCSTVDDKSGNAAGGGVYMAVIGTATEPIGTFRAVNTIFVNNTSVGTGGAIHVAGGSVDLMNNTIVSNKTATGPVINSDANKKVKMVNTLLWNNKSDSGSDSTIPGAVDITYSASDIDYNDLFAAGNTWHNFKLVSDNMDLSGPRFANPNMQVGAVNYNPVSNWNPIAQSPLTDTGNGKVSPDGSDYTQDATYVGDAQAYRDWFNRYAAEYINDYMGNADYLRYSGPLKDDGTADDRPIDIGLYEYQYRLDFSKMDAIYVDVFNRGLGNGQNWMNATDDLRGAIIGASNPTSNNNPIRRVFVKAGEYVDPLVALGSTYALHTGDKNGLGWTNLEIYGSCTGTTIKLKEQETQDFSAPTVIHNYPDVTAQKLLDISSNKNVFLSGITFINNTGCGIYVASNLAPLTLRNVAIRACGGDGLKFNENTGKVLLVNTLFADNKGNGLNVESVDGDNITLVNTTFAQNGTDMSKSLLNVYNSTSWNSGNQNMQETEGHYNKVFADNVNDDLNNGPRFRDPDNAKLEDRDYRIRPNFTLLNMGNEATYNTKAGVADMSTEKDLNNVARVVGNIDIGAYEFESDLRPIIYVKPGLLNSDKSGKDWDNAIDDLQDAVDLAGMYVNANKDKTNAYVFAHHTLKDTETLQVKYQGVKVYGGMNDEATTDTETDKIVTDLLDKRVGLLERDSRSELNGGLTISAEGSVVDGFEVNVSPVINKGILSTSVVTKDVTGKAEGILYNTLVKGSVSGVKTVNVTATGVIENVEGNGNNRTGAAGDNRYVTTDDWEYQLMETSKDIDAGTTDITAYLEKVGHDRDIAGNKRIRNTVDNGCFETWNITKKMTADNVVTEDDYPHGKSVVYVRHDAESNDGAELLITKDYTDATPFNPGFLLLEHHAGLRANNKAISLTHFAVERNIGTSGTDMTVMPFEVTRTEGTAALSLYDAITRAGYSYQYSKDSGAWEKTTYNAARTPITTGWLLEDTAGSKVRFYGDSYVENVDAGKSIELLKNNFNEPWTSSSAGGNRFTHKENMSWNLFGSPYLCAMNYSDMKYGRVMYGYQNGAYTTLNTVDDNAEGYIPAGDAVFTQTATLKERETIEVEIPTEINGKSGVAYQGSKDMTVALLRAYTRSGGDGQEDRLQLKAVPAGESRSDFDINGDGVKWMSAGRPQIYAWQGGGRYSLLSAVSIEGEVSVGVSLPEAGMYTFAISADCNVDDYETVVLKDNETGKTVDLLEGQYDFSTAAAGDVEGRFTISFNRMLNDKTDNRLRIFSPKRNTVRVEGLSQDDVVTVYSVSGATVTSCVASSSVEQFTVAVDGVVLVEVKHNGKVVVKKIRV